MSNITETCPLINQRCKKRKIENTNSSNDYFVSKEITYNLLERNRKPPDPRNGKYEWVWWDDKWIKMYNDVFENNSCCNCF